MGLDPFSAALAFRGLGVLTNLASKVMGKPGVEDIQEQLTSGDPLSQEQFDKLMERLLEIVNQATEGETSDPNLNALRAMAEHQKAMSPMLFNALDRDGSGTLEGGELRSLNRFVGAVREAAT